MSTAPVFTGVGVALATLFDRGGEVDAAATADHAAHLVELGVRAVVVAGSTGEAASLSAGERLELLAKVRTAVPGAVPVIAGTGAPSARAAVELTRAAAGGGADAALALSAPFAADQRPYYDAVARAAGDVPVLAYHYPAVSAPGIAVDAVGDLPVAGVKDSSGDPERLLALLDAYGGSVYAGSSALLVLAGAVGCTGAILALANVEPERCIRAFDGDGTAQRELAPSHLAAGRAFPAGIKGLMAARFGTPTTARMG